MPTMSPHQGRPEDSLPLLSVNGPAMQDDQIKNKSGEKDQPVSHNPVVIDIELVVIRKGSEKQEQCLYALTLDDHSLQRLKEQLRRLYGGVEPMKRATIVLVRKLGENEQQQEFDSQDDLQNVLTAFSRMKQDGDRIQCQAWFPDLDPRLKSSLLADLQDSRLRSVLTVGPFIPNAVLDKLLDETGIKDFCERDGDLQTISNSANKIFGSGRKLLATFLLAGLDNPGSKFKKAWGCGKSDAMLPFEIHKAGFLWLRDGELENLWHMQWQSLAMTFHKLSATNSVGTYHPEIPIPIIERKVIECGSFGCVYKIKIEASHQKMYGLSNDGNPYLALKHFRRLNQTVDFERELGLLLRIGQSRHPHLIQLLYAFKHGDDCYLILPLAKCSLKNCFEFEEENLQPFKRKDAKDFHCYVIWILKQFKGLASALDSLHEFGRKEPSSLASEPRIAYHHDFKPANILLFAMLEETGVNSSGLEGWEEHYGRLQLTDLGLGKIREQGTHTNDLRCTPTYAAPETVQYRLQGREADIWAFACVILEVFVWLAEGPKATEKFSSARNSEKGGPQVTTDAYFKQVSGNKYEVCVVATHKVDTIRKCASENDSSGPVNMIMDLIESCWKIERKDRPSASEVVKHLEDAITVAQRLPESQSFFKPEELLRSILRKEERPQTRPGGSPR